MPQPPAKHDGIAHDDREWLETDGLGGFASGTVGGARTRRYHALLLSSANPPTERFVLVNCVEAFVTTAAGTFPLSTHRYDDGRVVHPDGFRHIEIFEHEPWPAWTFRLPDGTRIRQEITACHGEPETAIAWQIIGKASEARLTVRPLLSGRDYHSLHFENPAFRFDAREESGDVVRWQPYPGVPAVRVHHNGVYAHAPTWYRRFWYAVEAERGFPANEDLASPGIFSFDLAKGGAVIIFTAHVSSAAGGSSSACSAGRFQDLQRRERERRQGLGGPLERAADQYLVRRGARGTTLIAGYPWFTDWGRDTFISLRGLCLATGRLDAARDILLAWAEHVSAGMLPNRFPDAGEAPEYNSVDASLWFVIAAVEYLQLAVQGTSPSLQARGRNYAEDDEAKRGVSPSPQAVEARLLSAVDEIVSRYASGTRYGIRMDEDCLLYSGAPGEQLTWMDARSDGKVVTPRIGKPVEVQALWLNALHLAARHWPRWRDELGRGIESFRKRFWNEDGSYLYDVIDCDGRWGALDASFRPNQVFAVGGLPLNLLEPAKAARLVDEVERRLVTPMGLRTLAPGEPLYAPRYEGSPSQRDLVYHQGTVWPWLMGPFVEAWVRVRGGTEPAKRQAHARFMAPLLAHLEQAGLGHISEIADAESPHTPRGCPFQAWSLGELLRLERLVLRIEPGRQSRGVAARKPSTGSA